MATKSAAQLARNTGDDGHIPTLPFGTKGVLNAPPIAREDSALESDFRPPFRFLVPTLPTSLSHEQGGAFLLPGAASDQAVAPTRRAERAPRSGSLLWLGAIALGVFAFALLVWPDGSNGSEVAGRPSERTLAHRTPKNAPKSAALDDSPRAVLAQAFVPATHLQSAPQPAPEPSRVAGPATRSASASSPRLTIPQAPTTLKRKSALASVLAPPPAD